MKKLVLMSVVLVVSTMAQAANYSALKSTQTNSAEVTIVSKDKSNEQAVSFVDASGFKKFLALQLKDKKSIFAKEKAALISANCESGAKEDDDGFIPDCGRVEFAEPVQIGFNRDGFADAYGEYAIFVGFREYHTGWTLKTSRVVQVTVTVGISDSTETSNTFVKKYEASEARPFEIF